MSLWKEPELKVRCCCSRSCLLTTTFLSCLMALFCIDFISRGENVTTLANVLLRYQQLQCLVSHGIHLFDGPSFHIQTWTKVSHCSWKFNFINILTIKILNSVLLTDFSSVRALENWCGNYDLENDLIRVLPNTLANSLELLQILTSEIFIPE